MKTFSNGLVGFGRLSAALLVLHAVDRRFGVARSRQGDLRADKGHTVADGISALSVGIGCARADAVGTVKKDGLFRHVGVRVRISRCALQCHKACEGYLQPAAIHVKSCTPRYKSLHTAKETQ